MIEPEPKLLKPEEIDSAVQAAYGRIGRIGIPFICREDLRESRDLAYTLKVMQRALFLACRYIKVDDRPAHFFCEQGMELYIKSALAELEQEAKGNPITHE